MVFFGHHWLALVRPRAKGFGGESHTFSPRRVIHVHVDPNFPAIVLFGVGPIKPIAPRGLEGYSGTCMPLLICRLTVTIAAGRRVARPSYE